MKKSDVIRAWKDPAFRASLSKSELAALPAHPAGAVDVSDEELGLVEGGAGSNNLYCPARQFVAINRNVSVQCPMVFDPRKILTLPGAELGARTFG